MHRRDSDRVTFYSKTDLSGGHELAKGEQVLRGKKMVDYNDINDILEIYNIKKYIDNELYLTKWTQDDVSSFKQKAIIYGKEVGKFIASINDTNVIEIYESILQSYVSSFWELFNNQNVSDRVSKYNFNKILSNEPYVIYRILIYKNLVNHYNHELRNFLLLFPKSAEILISSYESENSSNQKDQKFFPKSLTLLDKENIILKYLDSEDTNLNYIRLIENLRNKSDFKITDRTRLKAKRLHTSETQKMFSKGGGVTYDVSISFPENIAEVSDIVIEGNVFNYSYSLDYIKENADSYSLFRNFKILFEYIDTQNRVDLVSKMSEMGALERAMGIHSQNEYRRSVKFNLAELTSQAQMACYERVVNDLNFSLESILHYVYTKVFSEKYNFAENARFATPTTASSHFERVRILAPEFESILKQFKLFVEDGMIDFELLEISSSPSSIKDIPSINPKKYIYFNKKNLEMLQCSELFFSDQTLLGYVNPFKDNNYDNLYDLLLNETVNFDFYEDYQKYSINYLISKGLLSLDNDNNVQLENPIRVFIWRDLYLNEVASFYHYPDEFHDEVHQMKIEDIIIFESSLFSKPEQAYFNYFLNKSEFTNGLDLRNSYLHGTQANPNDLKKHYIAYIIYLKLLVLLMLKIDDDLFIADALKSLDTNTNNI